MAKGSCPPHRLRAYRRLAPLDGERRALIAAPLAFALPWLLLAGLALLNVGGLVGFALAKRGGQRACLLALIGLESVIVLVGLRAAAPTARAQSGGGYDLTWNTVDGGGYTLTGTIGQADAGAQSGGSYAVAGGFWSAFTQALYNLFLPLTVK